MVFLIIYELFKSDLIDNYISVNNLLLKQILPFKNEYSSEETRKYIII